MSEAASYFEGVANQLQATATILRQEPSKLNPCPTVWYVLVLTKVQGKGTLAVPKKNLPRLWTV